jgi:hypothetical protein
LAVYIVHRFKQAKVARKSMKNNSGAFRAAGSLRWVQQGIRSQAIGRSDAERHPSRLNIHEGYAHFIVPRTLDSGSSQPTVFRTLPWRRFSAGPCDYLCLVGSKR